MIFPQTNKPKDVNVAMIRVASENNKEIELMQQQVASLQEHQEELKARFKSQVTRWQSYRESYEATVRLFHLLTGTLSYDDIVASFPGYEG